MYYLKSYHWYENIRELANLFLLNENGSSLHGPSMPIRGDTGFDDATWEEVERKYALHLLQKLHWNVSWAARGLDCTGRLLHL